ncbi:MAG: tRNA lysidine(34) synthetase TilS [Pyrinomonadaceae bacterium]|nr:tRNA lysidine(34) synthetase TilS [Pyrinomonadaceae bacterium]
MTHSKTRLPTRPRLSTFAAGLLAEWRRLDLPVADASVVVGGSGGADSSALLLAFDELIKNEKMNLEIVVAHLDHGLRKDSRADARWVKQLVESLGSDIGVVIGKADLKKPRKTSGDASGANLEQAARKARYAFLHKIAKAKNAKLVVTAHTLDDQAETILMRLLRGSAAEGLSSIVPVRPLTTNSDISLIRPLVSWARRTDTENYCLRRKIDFRIDEMNDDETFSRVRIRKQLLPLMKSFNPRVVEALNRTAALLSEDAEALSEAAGSLLEAAAQSSGQTNETKVLSLSVSVLAQAPAALRRRALREWILRARGNLRRVEMVHLLAVEGLLRGERGGRVAELPGGMKVVRKRGRLELIR